MSTEPDSYCREHGVVRSVYAEMVGTHHCPICDGFVSPLAESAPVARQAVQEQRIGE